MAISIGHLIYYSIWETENTETTLMLSGENYEINILLEASSVELKEYEKKITEEKNLDNF
jgi:hypothetical protein